MNLIECKNLTLGYGNKIVLKNFNYVINAGDYISIVGSNGSGKTTLLKALAGLIKPKNGEVIFEKKFGKNQMGYLPQITAVQKDFPASVEEIVLSSLQGKKGLLPFYRRIHKEHALEAMKMTRVDNLSKSCFRELSGGQQQRVLLARAICAADKLLLLDEPVTGLDPESTESMYNVIEDLHKKNMTIVMVTHDIDAIAKNSQVLDFDKLK